MRERIEADTRCESVVTRLGRERNRGLMRTSRAADTARRAEGLWERLAEEIASVPDHEIERLRRARARQGHTVDSTHPPTHLRRRCLALGPAESPGSTSTRPARDGSPPNWPGRAGRWPARC
ncbi:hypothetical protein [Streptomyces sp. NPDC056600]|uniref:hypothetical protein n=1 Tax=Streptomyces sp. NPDC056600 TaxID=3345874 RepID=UPI0036907AB8